jgi:hypothetical protein
MKTRATTRVQGHVIVLTLVASILLGIVLLGVVSLSTNEGHLTGRSQSWNGAIPVAEAGIEEALTHLRYCPTNRASNGWTLVGDVYTKSRTIGSSRYDVTISTNYDPTIIAHGGIRAPHLTNYIVRTVRVMATNDPMFSAAIEASEKIDFKGNTIMINSYDSRDDRYSLPDGSYDPTRFKDRGKVVCHYGPFDMWNAKIYGHVETGEESALMIGPGGVVGSLEYHVTVGTGIQAGWHTSTTSSEFSTVEAPTGGIQPPRVGNTTVLGSAIYNVNSLQGSVVVNGQATVIINSDYNVSDLLIESGASIKLYVNAPNVDLKRIDNKNIRAESFMYYGLPGNEGITLKGNGKFIGVLFAPKAALGIGGGGSDEIDFLGAIIARTVTVNGKMTFHFDEATTRLGSRGFIACRWDEL